MSVYQEQHKHISKLTANTVNFRAKKKGERKGREKLLSPQEVPRQKLNNTKWFGLFYHEIQHSFENTILFYSPLGIPWQMNFNIMRRGSSIFTVLFVCYDFNMIHPCQFEVQGPKGNVLCHRTTTFLSLSLRTIYSWNKRILIQLEIYSLYHRFLELKENLRAPVV